MERSYAVAWQNGDGRSHAGRLDLGPSALRLEGGESVDNLPYTDLADVGITRQRDERLSGRPTLVLRLRDGRTVHIVSVGEPGALPELVERLSRSRATAPPPRS
jgi:hypothetical protein